ncbi:ATP-dependent DNA helicase [Trichonephila clavipes]|nr:ATP-dependent DNA helicase [Trichonephila clavipes]
MSILQSKKLSPFGKYYVVEYFKRIEFQHRGSPHAHILLWLNNAPIDAMGNDKIDAITLIDNLISVSSEEASVKNDGSYSLRKKPRIIRYRKFDMAQDLNEYKREMVSLHFSFRNEDAEILSELKFIRIYDENENLILSRRKDFESNLDIRKTIEICRCLCRDDDILDNENDQEAANRYPEPDPY